MFYTNTLRSTLRKDFFLIVQSKPKYNFQVSPAIRKIFTTVKMESDRNDNSKKDDLKTKLTPVQYHVTQEKGTEYPFSGEYHDTYDPGLYLCIVCKKKLFSSDTKFDSGCGWPAFNDVLEKQNVMLSDDKSLDMERTEVTCANCGSHLGHVFEDGPFPTGLRYCINSASLDFKSKKDK